jgi:uncharacterized protein (DUF1800 family)
MKLLRWVSAIGLAVLTPLASANPAGTGLPNAVEAVPHLQLNNQDLAARFLAQATFGGTPEEIDALARRLQASPKTAFADWIDDQMKRPVTPTDLSLNVFRTAFPPDYPRSGYRHHTNDAAAVRASLMISDDQLELRRKVAYVLSQIFVVSDHNTNLISSPEGMCEFDDILVKDAFGPFLTVLSDVTYDPVMLEYLTLLGSAKAGFYNPGSRPDENYAREVMQLFTIGLVKLNLDGTVVTDAKGRAIPTYDQPTITEVARAFTGLILPTAMTEALAGPADLKTMDLTGIDLSGDKKFHLVVVKKGHPRLGRDAIDEKHHDTGAKSFLGATLPAGQTTEQDINQTLAILARHPNTAPFLAKAMIQHLATSNPSPDYVKRVSLAFLNNQGSIGALVKAVLLDPEARNPAEAKSDQFGKLREPWLRYTQLARAFKAERADTAPYVPAVKNYLLARLGEFPFAAPSVFNFYLPTYQSPGVVAQRNRGASDAKTLVVDPEFEIMDSNTAFTLPNLFLDILDEKGGKGAKAQLPTLNLAPQMALADDPKALVDNVDLLLTAGMMSDRTRSIITQAVAELAPVDNDTVRRERAKLAIYLTLLSPDYAVQK